MKKKLTESQLKQFREYLKVKFPILSWIIRWRILKILENYREDPQVVLMLIDLLNSDSTYLKTRAEEILLSLNSTDAIDAICEYVILNPKSKAAEICLRKQYRPSDNERLILYFFVTRQLDEYFKEDHDFTMLRIIYEHSEQVIRERIMEVVREGDIRVQPFAIMPRKFLSQCTEEEIKLAFESCIRHKDWERLFLAALELPLKYSLNVFIMFRDMNWEPQQAEHKSLFERIKSHLIGFEFAEPLPKQWTSKLFDTWLSQGRRLEYQLLDEDVLFRRLDSAKPYESVSIVSALARKETRNERVIDKIRNHPHWLVRLAGLITGITKDIAIDKFYETNWWIKELAGLPGVLEFLPQRATPSDLAKLNNAPPSAYTGELGVIRSVLREILAYRVTTGSFAEMVIEATPTSAEFVKVGTD